MGQKGSDKVADNKKEKNGAKNGVPKARHRK